MTRSRARLLVAVVVLTVGAVLAVPPGAAARAGDDREVRVRGVCSRGSEVELRARSDDGSIRIELRIDTGRRGATWAVILLHERRIVFRRLVRTTRSSGSLRLRRVARDFYGRDTIVVRASGPRREVCRVAATL